MRRQGSEKRVQTTQNLWLRHTRASGRGVARSYRFRTQSNEDTHAWISIHLSVRTSLRLHWNMSRHYHQRDTIAVERARAEMSLEKRKKGSFIQCAARLGEQFSHRDSKGINLRHQKAICWWLVGAAPASEIKAACWTAIDNYASARCVKQT